MAAATPSLTSAVIDGTAPRGTRVGDVTIEALLGKGAFGVVYRGVDAKGLQLALKVAAKTKAKKSKNLVDSALFPEYTAYNGVWGATHKTPAARAHLALAWKPRYLNFGNASALAMPLAGATLDHARLPLPWDTVRRVADGVLDALDVLHDVGFVYLDLKPDNVAMDDGGDVQLIDLGMVRQTTAVTAPQGEAQPQGTPQFASTSAAWGLLPTWIDDAESLCYVLGWLASGWLPWSAATSAEQVWALKKRSAPEGVFARCPSPARTALSAALRQVHALYAAQPKEAVGAPRMMAYKRNDAVRRDAWAQLRATLVGGGKLPAVAAPAARIAEPAAAAPRRSGGTKTKRAPSALPLSASWTTATSHGSESSSSSGSSASWESASSLSSRSHRHVPRDGHVKGKAGSRTQPRAKHADAPRPKRAGASAAVCAAFAADPTRNPRTGYAIRIGGPTHRALTAECAPPKSAARSKARRGSKS